MILISQMKTNVLKSQSDVCQNFKSISDLEKNLYTKNTCLSPNTIKQYFKVSMIFM
jgi:hypothetical protein